MVPYAMKGPVSSIPLPNNEPRSFSRLGDGFGLFLISLVILFLELACIRWFPAHVLYLTFFTNVMLLACFLGMSVGCLAAGHRRNYITWTPALLGIAVVAGHVIEYVRGGLEKIIDVGHPS